VIRNKQLFGFRQLHTCLTAVALYVICTSTCRPSS